MHRRGVPEVPMHKLGIKLTAVDILVVKILLFCSRLYCADNAQLCLCMSVCVFISLCVSVYCCVCVCV